MEKQCFLGLKKCGVSVQIDKLSNKTDHSSYDYFCDVSLVENDNGNGQYTVSFFDKQYAQGFPMGKWTILQGYIGFNWGNSSASFILMDEYGNETPRILTNSSQRGAAGGFDLELHVRSMIIAAQKTIGEYPSVSIYNAITKLKSSKPNSKTMTQFKSIDDSDSEEFVDTFICNTLDKLNTYFNLYKETINKLKNSEDLRAKRLLQIINKESKEIINSIF